MNLKVTQWIINANKDGVCEETGKDINTGDEILYLPGVRGVCSATVYHKDSREYARAEKDSLTGWKI